MKLSKPILTAAALLVLGSCRSIFGPHLPDDNWQNFKSLHCEVYVRPNSYAHRDISTLLQQYDAHYQKIIQTLELQYFGRVSVFLFNSPQDAGLKGCEGFANPRTETIQEIYGPSCDMNINPHELAHVITWNALGEPGTMLLNDGLAEAMNEAWNGKHHHLWTKQYLNQGQLPSIETLADNMKWFKTDAAISYPVSSSFVKYMIEMYGVGKIRQLFYQAISSRFKSDFQSIYGMNLADVEEAWKHYCRNYQ